MEVRDYYRSLLINRYQNGGVGRKEFKDQLEYDLAVFDTYTGNAVVGMVKSMIKYVNGGKIEDSLRELFSETYREYKLIVDNKTDEITKSSNRYEKYSDLRKKGDIKDVKVLKEMEKEGIMKIRIKGPVIYFSYNKPLEISALGIPPTSFYQYLRTRKDIDVSNIKYCVICIHQDLDNICDNNKKGIFISNIPHGRQDLVTYSLRDKVIDLNELETNSIKGIVSSIEEEINKLKSKLKEIENNEEYIVALKKQKDLLSQKSELNAIIHRGNNSGLTQEDIDALKRQRSELDIQLDQGQSTISNLSNGLGQIKSELKKLEERKKNFESKVGKKQNNGFYNTRNGFMYISNSSSALNDIVDILQ